MAYLHEKTLQDAVRRLNFLGRSDRPMNREKQQDEAAGAAIGSVFKKATQQRSNAKNSEIKASSPENDAAQAKKLKELTLASQGMRMGQVGPGGFDAMEVAPTPEEAAQGRLDTNNLAENMAVGGQWTPKALELNAVTAEKNAQDRMRLKAMAGIAGTTAPGYGYIPQRNGR